MDAIVRMASSTVAAFTTLQNLTAGLESAAGLESVVGTEPPARHRNETLSTSFGCVCRWFD